MTLLHPAVAAVAGIEWRRRRRSILVIGLAAAAVGGLLTGTAALTARTASAPDRLVTTVDPGDARVLVFGGEAFAADIAALDSVTASAGARVMVARMQGPYVQYLGMASTPTSELAQPVIIEGRRANPNDPTEAQITEHLAAWAGLGPGDVLSMALLTAEEVTQFDTGFGEPDGARVDLQITGVARVPPGLFDTAPVLVTPAFADAHPESVAGIDLYVELTGGAGAFDAFAADVSEAAAAAPRTAGGDEFPPALVQDPYAATRALERSSRVLVGGLGVVLLVGALAALLALAQAQARHHAWSTQAQRVERALGMPAGQRAVARAIPWLPAAVLAAGGAAALGLAAGALEPLSPLHTIEPDPGYRPEIAVVALSTLATVGAVLAVSLATAWRAGRPVVESAGPRRGRAGLTSIAPRHRGWTLAGTVFALSGAARGRGQTRTSLTGAILGVAGIVAGLTFAGTLERLVETPARYGWTADLSIADVNDEIVQRFDDDARFSAVVDIRTGSASINGTVLKVYSYEPVRGVIGWVYFDGRSPQWSGEVALGTKAAESLDAEVGDRVTIGGLGDVEVAGIGVSAPLSGEAFAESVLLDTDAMERAERDGAVEAVFRELALRVAGGQDERAVIGQIATEFETFARELPQEVQDLADIGRLPELLGAFLAMLGVMAVVHGVVVTTRQRATDLAVLRSLGTTPRQSGLAVVAMAIATVAVGLVAGVPLGWATARLVWSILAKSVGVEPGVAVPASVAAVVFGALLLAAAVAVLPARRVAALDPATLLRAE
ncbi:hypothetical protein BH23ACT3_BH23ACT3_02260 [soil metagenome]